ncbi:MAG TPA: ATP-binding cassette domain-containing protein [candidate division Zixibacteria bacterium]
MLKVTGLSKIYDKDIAVLEDITFEVKRGEFVVILGPSGAGKTTIFRHIWLEELPTKGEIEFEKLKSSSIRKSQIPFWRKRMGIVFQDLKLLNDRDVFENVALPLRIKGKREKEITKKTIDILNQLGLLVHRSSYPFELSAGEKQRLALARAMVAEPLIILADEPTVHLDAESASGIISLLRDANLGGTTILMATNQRGLLGSFAHRVIGLEKGRIV